MSERYKMCLLPKMYKQNSRFKMLIKGESQKVRALWSLYKIPPEHDSLKSRHPQERILYPPLHCPVVDVAKMNWAFKLYDVDNDGMIDIKEMAVIMETLDSIEGVVPGIQMATLPLD